MATEPLLQSNANPINCRQCRYFAISWDPAFPNSCKFYGFKTRYMPSVDVLRLDGHPCQGFANKLSKVSEFRL